MSACPAAGPSGYSSRKSGNCETRYAERAERRARRPAAGDCGHRYRQWRAAPGQGEGFRRRSPACRAFQAIRMGKSANVEVGGKKLFLNVYAPTARMVIIGAVHISQALAPLARSLGYDVTVV